MARTTRKLTVLGLRKLDAPGRYGDGDGLYLYVSKTGNRSWVFRYRDRTTGKIRDNGLGPLRDVTLEQAREAAHQARARLRGGEDPIDAKRSLRAEASRMRALALTFETCTQRYIEAHQAEWKNAKHLAQWRSTLATYASPVAKMPVAAIDTSAVLKVLEPIWITKTETATRVRQRIEAVLDWARARNYRSGDNPARWRGHLDHLLPRPQKVKKVQPRAAVHYDDLPSVFAEIREQAGVAPVALLLQILTASRPGEVVGARWGEFDLNLGIWTIPAIRMKAGVEHRIPLCEAATSLLIPLRGAGEVVFPGPRRRPLTTAALLKVLQRLRPGLSTHGFRSTFRDWAADMTAYSREIAERALAHRLEDKTEAAYFRTDMFVKRTQLMADWGAYCAGNTAR